MAVAHFLYSRENQHGINAEQLADADGEQQLMLVFLGIINPNATEDDGNAAR
jgi:hypothetical protein